MMNYQWNFPINKYLEEHPHRMTRIEREMKKVREARGAEFSNKKLKEIELLKTGKLSSVGFAGSQLVGLGATAGSAAYNTGQGGMGGMGGTYG